MRVSKDLLAKVRAQHQRATAAADERMAAAKAKFSAAAVACLRGQLDAQDQVRAALDEVDRARAALREANDER